MQEETISKQVRVLTLETNGDLLSGKLYRLKKGWQMRFMLGPSLQAEDVRIFCNHPNEKRKKFSRTLYHEFLFVSPTDHRNDTCDTFAMVDLVLAGSFHFYFTIDGSDQQSSVNGQGYFLVDPTLTVGVDHLPLDCIQCQTVISKSLGSMYHWEGRLKVAKETGYNMIHFTPIQELGHSNSAYSIRDQLMVNPTFSDEGKTATFKDVLAFVRHMEDDWGVLSMTDLVYNHTSSDTPWLQANPECSYNLVNTSHLKPAFLMDRMLWHVTLAVADGKLEYRGIVPTIQHESDLQLMEKYLMDSFLPIYKLYEFYTCDVEAVVKKFKKLVQEGKVVEAGDSKLSEESLHLIQDPEYRRLETSVSMTDALAVFNVDKPGVKSRDERIKKCCEDFENHLVKLNQVKIDAMNDHIATAVKNFLANIRYRFVQDDGLRLKTVTRKQPLMDRYFTFPVGVPESSVEDDESLMDFDDTACIIMAHNGWVMNYDPRKNFAHSDSNVYLRRELIVWSDSVKLRYGESPADCPFLWDLMLEYTRTVVNIFHAIRLDNCHSTPVHVAEFMMDAARKVRPELYVVAELFTTGESLDNLFINHLGITTLIREAMSAWDSHEEGRLVHRYGGVPVGAFIQPHVQPLVPCVAHAIFYDMTHDNPSPIEKRCVYDALPTSALVAMACCASGSNRGYDELVPHHIHVVKEKRPYTYWNNTDNCGHMDINMANGIIAAKRALNDLHYELGIQGYSQVFVDQMNVNVVAVTRHNPTNHKTVVLIAHTSFTYPPHSKEKADVRPVIVTGNIDEVILEAKLVHHGSHSYHENKDVINGLPDFSLKLKKHIQLKDSEMATMWNDDNGKKSIGLTNLTPGSVIAFRVTLDNKSSSSIKSIKSMLQEITQEHSAESDDSIRNIISQLSLVDLNKVLYRCPSEEMDDAFGFGAYDVPNYGPMIYCGLQGIMSLLSKIRPANDLGHPLCANLRDGDWLAGYTARRLKVHATTKKLGEWLERFSVHLGGVPRYLVPCYFEVIITGAYMLLLEQSWNLMSSFVNNGSSFVHSLAMGSIQMCGEVKSSPLPGLSPSLKSDDSIASNLDINRQSTTLAAGLPHFADGIMRNWGRDTFIALRGLLLLTGRYQEARLIILSFGGCLRHGLIPNLLGGGEAARFNCRDAIWWWLQSIQDYCKEAPHGNSILQDPVSRLFPEDDSPPMQPGVKDQPLHQIILESLQKHATGVSYRECNAGFNLDRDMSDQGFNNNIGVDWATGFVLGGNINNCGTWMDKMGSSEVADTKGMPATPRDGSAVELVGLCKSAVSWLAEISQTGVFPHKGIYVEKCGQDIFVLWKEWSDKIQEKFETLFWISGTPDPDNEPKPELINIRGMYKDSHLASQFWADYQLRPNFPVAMVVAPELFSPNKAWTALQSLQEELLGPLGMKTLQASDWAYCGDYNNADVSTDPKVAHGFNYHNGPEWVWPVGYFLRAKLHFAKMLEASQPGVLSKTVKFVTQTLTHHNEAIQTSDWRSLPELTNQNGAHCRDSCPAQAWSMATILEAVRDLELIF